MALRNDAQKIRSAVDYLRSIIKNRSWTELLCRQLFLHVQIKVKKTKHAEQLPYKATEWINMKILFLHIIMQVIQADVPIN